jgi:hypothetical protein
METERERKEMGMLTRESGGRELRGADPSMEHPTGGRRRRGGER